MATQRSARGAQGKKSPRRVRGGGPGKRSANSQSFPDASGNHAELARELVLSAWTEIIQGLIEKAASGGYQQAKLLLDVSGLASMAAKHVGEQKKRQLCDALLDGLQIVDVSDQRQAEEKPEGTQPTTGGRHKSARQRLDKSCGEDDSDEGFPAREDDEQRPS